MIEEKICMYFETDNTQYDCNSCEGYLKDCGLYYPKDLMLKSNPFDKDEFPNTYKQANEMFKLNNLAMNQKIKR